MVQTSCRKCPYFDRKDRKDSLFQGSVITGFCRLRQMHVTDVTMNNEQCKDRAVLSIPENKPRPE